MKCEKPNLSAHEIEVIRQSMVYADAKVQSVLDILNSNNVRNVKNTQNLKQSLHLIVAEINYLARVYLS